MFLPHPLCENSTSYGKQLRHVYLDLICELLVDHMMLSCFHAPALAASSKPQAVGCSQTGRSEIFHQDPQSDRLNEDRSLVAAS